MDKFEKAEIRRVENGYRVDGTTQDGRSYEQQAADEQAERDAQQTANTLPGGAEVDQATIPPQPPVDNDHVEEGAQRFEPAMPPADKVYPQPSQHPTDVMVASVQRLANTAEDVASIVETMNLDDVDERTARSLTEQANHANGLITAIKERLVPKPV